MKKIILSFMLICLSSKTFGLSEEIKRLFDDAKVSISEKAYQALSPKVGLTSDEQIIMAIKNKIWSHWLT